MTATGVADGIDTGDRPVTVTMAATSTDSLYSSISIDSVGVTMTDDDTAGITVSPTVLSMFEDEGSSFSVVLTSKPEGTVQINMSADDTSVVNFSPSGLGFTDSNWATPQIVTVSGINDGDDNGPNRSTTIELSLDNSGSYPVEPDDVYVTVRNAGTVDDMLVQSTFEEVTGAFIGRRMDRIIAAEPQGYRLDRRRTASGTPQFSLSTKGDAGELSLTYGRTSADSTWHSWIEAASSLYNDGTGALGTRDGHFGMLSVGTDYLVNQGLAIGLMVQVDKASEEIDGFSDISGTGWLAGPYLSMEVAPDLYFSARAAWGDSSNDAAIDIAGDLFTGSFSTRRSLARAMLYGKLEMGETKLTPSAELVYMSERQGDYTVSNGIHTTPVDGIDAELWRLSMATDIETPLRPGNGSMIFFARPQLDWTFQTNGIDVPERASGSIELGLRTGPASPWSGEVAVGYQGIGQADFEGFTSRVMVSFRF